MRKSIGRCCWTRNWRAGTCRSCTGTAWPAPLPRPGMLLRHSVLEALGPHGLLGTDPPPVFNPTPVGEVSLKYGIGAYDAFAFTEARRTDTEKYHLRGAMNLYFIFPNVIMGLMRDCYWMYNVWAARRGPHGMGDWREHGPAAQRQRVVLPGIQQDRTARYPDGRHRHP